MNVHVHGNFYITSDSQNIMLEEVTGKTTIINKGKENEKEVPVNKNHGYFGTVEQALRKFVRLQIQDSPAKDIKELISEVQALNEMIKEKVQF